MHNTNIATIPPMWMKSPLKSPLYQKATESDWYIAPTHHKGGIHLRAILPAKA